MVLRGHLSRSGATVGSVGHFRALVTLMFSVEPRHEDHFFPGTESSSYLFHLTPQPVDAAPLGFGDSSVAHLMDGDSRAGCGGMNGPHCKGNTHRVLISCSLTWKLSELCTDY